MSEEKKKGFPTWGMVLIVVGVVLVFGCIIVSIFAAIAIPSLLRSRIAANESSAVATLRSLVTTESTWRQTDADRNTISDYWSADVSGFWRVERLPDGCGVSISAIDVAVATADDAKIEGGAAFPGAKIPGTDVRSAALIALNRAMSKSGYWFRAIELDQNEAPLATDPDGDGRKWTNVGAFGFQARPGTYDSTGLNTYIVSETGAVYGRDFRNSLPQNARAWPGPNPITQGWRLVP